MNKAWSLNPTRPVWPGFSSSISLCGDANRMEQLLLDCANAIESNDATLTQQIIWVLNNLASPDGDYTQRLASSFLRALISRAVSKSPALAFLSVASSASVSYKTLHRFSVIELATFVDLTPWHRFGFIAANAAILDAVEGYSSVHIVDLSITHCMQIPTLIDSIATKLRENPRPLLKLTVVVAESPPPPLLGTSYEELGLKLVNFATTRNIAMEFRIIPSSHSDGLSSLIEQLRLDPFVFNEALVINCHMMLHYIPDDTLSSYPLRSVLLKEIHDLNPTIVTLIDEDADFTSSNFISRLKSLYNFMWIPYDSADTFLARGIEQRRWYEADIDWKIDNVVAKEGSERVERLEPKSRWFDRMRKAKFAGVGFGEAAATEVKTMVEEHATGWGMKRDVDDDDLDRFVLTWKGHSVVFASAWVPINEIQNPI